MWLWNHSEMNMLNSLCINMLLWQVVLRIYLNLYRQKLFSFRCTVSNVCLRQCYVCLRQCYVYLRQCYVCLRQCYVCLRQCYACLRQCYACLRQCYVCLRQCYVCLRQCHVCLRQCYVCAWCWIQFGYGRLMVRYVEFVRNSILPMVLYTLNFQIC